MEKRKRRDGRLSESSRYKAGALSCWQGRSTPPGLAPAYWYQRVTALDLNAPVLSEQGTRGIAFLGYACEEGVRRNQGRIGAADGPEAIRKMLAKMANHLDPALRLFDAGTVSCPDGDLESTQEQFGERVLQLLEAGFFPVLLGGGHDIAYATHRGLQAYVARHQPDLQVGVINLDAHFDLRKPVEGPNSGTPFFQIASEKQNQQQDFHYLVLGIQPAANTPSLFQTATELKVQTVTMSRLHTGPFAEIVALVDAFIAPLDHVHLSIDLDGFASAFAPGVSAPSPMGMDPQLGLQLLRHIWQSGKVMALEVAEMNPLYDQDGGTARLAARLIGVLLQGA